MIILTSGTVFPHFNPRGYGLMGKLVSTFYEIPTFNVIMGNSLLSFWSKSSESIVPKSVDPVQGNTKTHFQFEPSFWHWHDCMPAVPGFRGLQRELREKRHRHRLCLPAAHQRIHL